jgi:1-phosphofructokinase
MSSRAGAVAVALDPFVELTATVEGFAAGRTNHARAVRTLPRGKGFDVAAHLSTFGFPVVATGWLGRDDRAIFDRFLVQRGIDGRFVGIGTGTRIQLTVADPVDRRMTRLDLPGSPPEAADIDRLASVLADLAHSYEWCILSGALPPGLPDTVLRNLIRPLVDAGQRVLIDVPGSPFRLALEARPFAVKPNLEELCEAVGRPVDTEEEILAAVDELVALGIGCVIVSMGADGAIFAEGGRRLHVRPPAVVVASTTGAGDAMIAGFVAGKLRGYDFEGCARLATAASVCALGHDVVGRPVDLRSIEAAVKDGTVRVLASGS